MEVDGYSQDPVLTAKTRKKPQSACKQGVLRLLKVFRIDVTSRVFVTEQIFLMTVTGTICVEVQKPKASCKASVSAVRV